MGKTSAFSIPTNQSYSRFDCSPTTLPAGPQRPWAMPMGDGVPALFVGNKPGSATQVRVFSGRTRAELFVVAPFESSFTGNVYVATGDLDGDGRGHRHHPGRRRRSKSSAAEISLPPRTSSASTTRSSAAAPVVLLAISTATGPTT